MVEWWWLLVVAWTCFGLGVLFWVILGPRSEIVNEQSELDQYENAPALGSRTPPDHRTRRRR
jgi:hypothetical protein